ncbi:MAG: 4'-phosphopantetheinyl transferase superfamily protein [Polyangiaceae bacterium]|nr:4'-phosphopantetheinyl transferase superfamily protein [Polyangiaceae bacterium]
MSRLLSQIVPRGVFCQEMTLAQEAEALFPEEAAAVARAVESRRHEFSAGRTCARRALAELGLSAAPLLANEDRSPRWPQGVVGSIAHTGKGHQGWCGAAVGRAEHWRGIGIDAEDSTPLRTELWSRVLGSSELRWLQATPATDAGLMAKIVFCAKEAFYKCQYLTTRAFLGFTEVEVEFDLASSQFRARVSNLSDAEREPKTKDALCALPALTGRYCVTPALVLAAIAWPNTGQDAAFERG